MRGRIHGIAMIAAGLVVGAGGTALLMWSQPDAAEAGDGRRILYWRAPMDPNYISDQPGKSPMGMDLVPVYEDEVPGDADMADMAGEGAAGETHEGMGGTPGDPQAAPGGSIRVSRAFLQNFAVRTAEVRRGTLPISIRTVGILAHNEERVVSVQTKYEGWIERARVNNVGETVTNGDVLFEIYSPELVTTQRDFLGAMEYVRRLREGGAYAEAVVRAQSLLEAARERLLYWDMTEDQVDALAESQTVDRTVRVFAPASGFVVEKMGDSMEGMKLSPGMTVLKIADHSTLWAETEFYEDDLRHVREGQRAVIEADAFPGREWSGRILFFRPAVNAHTRTLTAFVEVANPDLLLRPRMYVNVSVVAGIANDVVIVPAEAILRSGTRAVAIVSSGGGVFEPREVVLGTESTGMQEVVAGLAEGETIVVSSQFLIDSDANLRAAISQLLGSGDPAEGMSGHEPANARDSAGATDTMPHRR